MKRKLIVLGLVVGLAAGSLAMPAEAKKKKKKKKPKPVATTMYFHGNAPLGEADGVDWFANSMLSTILDGVEPSGSQPKSMSVASPALNDQCTGLPLAFPTFQGDLQGTIVGDMHLFANFASAPGTIKARLWTDTPIFTCNDSYIEPAAEVDVALPAGQGEVDIVFEGLNLKAEANVLIEILAYSGTDYKGQVGRFLYDSTSAASRIEFDCVPASGSSCIE